MEAMGEIPAMLQTPLMKGGRKSGGARKTGKRSTGGGMKKPSSHPPYGAMIKAALKHLKDRKGSSRMAIFKYIIQNYKLGGNMAAVNSHLRMALKRGVQSGELKQAKGTGASGSFRLGEGKVSKGRVRKAKKPRAKKTTTARRSTGMKKAGTHKRKPSAKKPKTARKSTGTKRKASGKKSAGGVKKARRSTKKHTKKSVKA